MAAMPQSSAATLSETETFSFVPTGSAILTFNKFDSGLGTLTGIKVSFSLTKTGGSLAADNDSEESGTVSFSHYVTGSLSSADVALLNSSFQPVVATLEATSSTTQVLEATTGDPTNAFNATGLGDYYLFVPSDASASGSGSVGAAVWAGYIGIGTFNINVNLVQGLSATGVSAIQQALVNSSAHGSVTVEYTYDAVPEPGTALLVGAGSMLMLLRRRRRA